MLTRIELKDFQCHKDLVLDLDKITTLVGASDSGKSAVIRALDWAVYNNGRTAQLIRRGAKAATVTIQVDGHTVTRTTKKNAYIVDGTELSSIGRSQPVDVPNIFRMGEDNIQRQHEYLFWFSASGSELTRNFNRVVDLSQLDEWVRAGADIERKYKQDVQYCSQRLSELAIDEQNLLPYEELDKALHSLRISYETLVLRNQHLDTIRQLHAEYVQVDQTRTVLEAYRDRLADLLAHHDEIVREKLLTSLCCDFGRCAESLVHYWELVTYLKQVLARFLELKNLKTSFLSMFECCRAYRDAETRLERLRVAASTEIPFDELFSLRKELSELAEIIVFLRPDTPDASPVFASLEGYREASSQLYEISTLVSAIGFNNDAINDLRLRLDREREEFATASEGLCPLCGQRTEGRHLHE